MLALGIVLLDTLTMVDIAFSFFYVLAVILARLCRHWGAALAALGYVALAVLSYFLSLPGGRVIGGIVDTLISIGTIALTAFLAKDQTRKFRAKPALHEARRELVHVARHATLGELAASKRLLRFWAVLAIAAPTLAGCGSRNTFVPPPPAKVVVAQPVQKPVTLYVFLTGNTAPYRTANLVARVQGFLETIDYKDGAAVTKGTQLFGIERDTYQAQVDQFAAQLAKDQSVLAQAQVNLTRYQTLEQQKSIAAQQAEDQGFVVQQNKATVGIDQANLQTANINLGFTTVTAPFDGIVTNHLVDIGNLVGASGPTTLATIVQTHPIYVNFTLSEPQFLTIRRSNAKAGLPVSTADLTYLSTIPIEIGLQDEEGYPHKGHLDYVSPQVDAATGTVAVRAIFDNDDNALLPGLFVRVRGPVGRQDKALLTRNDAIGTGQEGSYVLVVGADNVVQRKIVKTGQRQGQFVIIESGLDPTDWVVIEGIQQAFPGAKVEVQRSELKADESGASDDAKTDAKTNAPNPTPK
jgi:membrane fusion protein, multidrug efflux system